MSTFLLEVSSRLYFGYFHRGRPPHLTDLFVPDPYVGYANKPLFQAFWCGVDVNTNSAGFRNYELKFEKPENVFRIMVLGDSITFGWWVEQDETFSSLLEKKFNRRKNKNKNKNKNLEKLPVIQVINTGVLGYSTHQERIFFERKGFLYKPDLVILAYCINDLYPTENPFGNLPFVLRKSRKRDVVKREFFPESFSNFFLERSVFFTGARVRLKNYFRRKRMEKIFYGLEENKIKTGTVFLKKTFQEWKKMYTSVLDKGASFMVTSFPQPCDIMNRKTDSFFAPLDEEMRKNGFNGINLAGIFPEYKGDLFDLYYEKDMLAVHLSVKGHELVAETLFRYLMESKLVPG